MALIDDNGITIDSLLEWKATLDAIYLAIDPEWNIDSNTLDGQVIAAFAEMLANVDEAILDSYNAADPDKAIGVALDAILELSNISRRQATYSTAVVQLTGVASTVVSAGTKIENAVTGTKWSLDAPVVLTGGADDANVTCDTVGAQTAGIGELTKIATPVNGLQSVNNSASAIVGQNEMTDTEARIYRENTISNPGSNSAESIYAAVALVTGVSQVAIYNNRTASVDSNGLPARSFSVIVNGGADADIAQAIYNKLPPGPAMYGGSNAVNEVVNSQVNSNSETITFGRVTDVPLYLEVLITETGDFPDEAVTEIKNNIVAFANGTLFDQESGDGNRRRPFQIGEDISSGMLFTPVNYYVGASGQGYCTDIYIDTSSSPSAGGVIAIDWESLATIDPANITVTIT